MEKSVPASSEQVKINNVKKRPKNIILLSDGTGNSARKLFKTNVWRLYQALDLSECNSDKPGDRKQIAHYNDGVGTSSFKPMAIIGGAFGYGTKRIVVELYTFLCRHYEDDDNIYAFGFSRGAFAIRMLVGLIADQGLVKANTESELKKLAANAFRNFRRDNYPRSLLKPFRAISKLFSKDEKAAKREIPRIKFLGLWDTVAAYGLPVDELTRAYDFIFPLSFPDHNLSPIVDCAYHALAIDDERLTFHPELWNEKEEDYKEDNDKYDLEPLKDRLRQVWFSGMHSNIGGGYPDDGMSSVPLNWILNKAVDKGLRLLPSEGARLREASCINGRIYDSRRGLGGAYRYAPRNIYELTHYNDGKNDKEEKNGIKKPKRNRIVIDKPKIHVSVLQRINGHVDGYAPIGLPAGFQIVGSDDEVLEPGNVPELSDIPNGLIGNTNQVEDRKNRQEKLWNLVWWKRIVYFMSIIVFIWLVAFPFYPKFHEKLPYTDTRWLYPLSAAIGRLGEILPNFLGKWLRSYQSYPGYFILMVAVFAVILWVGSRLQKQIFGSMRSIFDDPLKGTTPTAEPKGFVHWLRTNPNVKEAFRIWRENVAPFIVLIIALLFIIRGIFKVIDTAGFTSTSTPVEQRVSRIENREFPSNSICWASGVQIDKGKRYRITLTINGEGQSPWKDSTIDQFGLAGFGREKMSPLMYGGLLFRRHLMENWFKPIARIGEYGTHDYPLDPVDVKNTSDNMLVSEINARHSGELFLFVNDSVLPFPNGWQKFYGNNNGTAKVTIEPLPSDCCNQTK